MRSTLRAAVFGAAIFASATLIFLVQPLVGKRILPWFGGAPAVWTLCLAFYQTTLFLGYAYAHGLVRFSVPRVQVGVHALVLMAAAMTLPVLPGDASKPALDALPESAILAVLIRHVALPFLALAATGPLVQSWFALRYPDRSPYFLYSVSNLGSLLGLLGYSFFLESTFSVSATGTFWSGAFVACAVFVLGAGAFGASNPAESAPAGVPVRNPAASPGASLRQVFSWTVLSASAVILLTGLTNELTIDVASFPFLWVLMLAAYLASFIVSFASERAYSRPLFLSASAVLLLLVYGVPLLGTWAESLTTLVESVQSQLVLYALLLFSLTMVLHGELYRLRPGPADLTRFYLFVSGGGALGGLFAGIAAPRLLNGFFEVFVGLGLGWLALLLVWAGAAKSDLPRRRGAVGAKVAGIALGTLLVFGLQIGRLAPESAGRLIHQERTFFGVLRISDAIDEAGFKIRILKNGVTRHGYQAVEGVHRRRPTAYYGVHTGIGFALRERSVGPPLEVGIVGLGIGTLAAYGRPGDRYRFYEIDPAVERIARDDGYFSFLADSRADIEVVTGDARLALAAEAAADRPRYDLLVVDAFTSDAIPIHLLTREALELYDQRLKTDGLLAFHISNRHFDFEPVVARLGSQIGYATLFLKSVRTMHYLSGNSKWAFLSRDPATLERLRAFSLEALRQRQVPEAAISFEQLDAAALTGVPLWTDDYSDLLGAIE